MIFELTAPRRRMLLGGLACLLILAGAALPFLPRSNSIENMLPTDSRVHRMLRFLQDARFAGQVAVSLERPAAMPFSEFTDAMDHFAAELSNPYIENITARIDLQSAGEEILFFQQNLPALIDADQIKSRLTPEVVNRVLHRKYTDLIKPGGALALPLIRRDPLELQQDFLNRLQALSASSGYTVELKEGYLFSPDGRHALVILETSAPITDVAASRDLLQTVEAAVSKLPGGIIADVVCGHRHAVSNEEVLKRDVQRAVLAGVLGFILLFAFCFRDPRAQFIFAIPLASVLLSIHICRWFTGPVSLFVLGFGVVIVGIAVDYGIHVYVALRRSQHPAVAWRGVVRPVVLGALTTLGVFTAFFAAHVPGYSQMAVFSIFSILLSLLGALFVLPLLIRTGAAPHLVSSGRTIPSGVLFCGWAVLLIALVFPFPRLSFESDLRTLDGSDESVWSAEERFRSVWGSGAEGLALAIVSAPSYDEALELNDRLYDAITAQGDADEFNSFSSVWKSAERRRENLERWQALWTEPQIQRLRATIAEQGAPFGFTPDAFDPFFQSLKTTPALPVEPDDNAMFNRLKERFVQSLDGSHQLVSFFPDTESWMERVRCASGGMDALLISRREINRLLSEGTVETVKRVSLFAVALVVLFTALLMRRPADVVLALIPAAVSVLAVLKVLTITGLSVNIPTLISGIVVIGLAIDYGIFMVFGCKRGTLDEIRTAVTLSTVTSLIGAGVLLLTKHPALFSIGVTLVAGLTAGYVSALCAVPFFARFLLQEKEQNHDW